AQILPRLAPGTVRDELTRVAAELTAGKTLARAMADFAARTPSPAAEAMARALVQGDQLGADITDTLAGQAAAVRGAYEADADQRSARLQTQLLYPIILLMVPPLFILILAPALSQITHVL